MTELVLPSHCDGRGFCLGGTVLSWIDIAAGIAAKKHGVFPAVTRSVDAVHFLGPITTKNIVILQASVNRAWKTSMEVGVRVMTEDLLSADRYYCCHAYLTFVALPQAPLTILKSGQPQTPSQRHHRQQQQQQEEQQQQQEEAEAARAALISSPAARRYSFSLPSSKSESKSGGQSQQQRSIQLPAIEPVSPVEMERYKMAQSRREARLKQASEENEEEEQRLLSDVRDQMRRWNVSHAQNPKFKKDGGDGGDTDRVEIQATFAESAQLVLPQHANSLSITFGGQVMKWMESIAAVSASRFARVPIVTASIDSLQFHRKTMIGDCLTMRSVVTRVFKSSMEVYVFVDSENLITGKQTFTNEAFFSMVALQPAPSLQPIRSQLPLLVPGSDMERALSEAGEKRRLRRLSQRRELAEREMQGMTSAPKGASHDPHDHDTLEHGRVALDVTDP
ncbi:Acyl-coenzyme A thioesterase 11 [Mortierella alpina]|uniref:Acyl-coenzyme A thioesterase 11 n=1 Tax=Mortierella alpina TaxID=64518 RepID=A0A9P6M587_MORAP|nr:Acyl-coenzyme A thioesterase 11 [Mortierella alpina]